MKNTFANSSKQTLCINCPIGWTALSVGSVRCQRCEQGKFGINGHCEDCPTGWKRATIDKALDKCLKCADGQTTSNQSATTCEKCDVGLYLPKSLTKCLDCPSRFYQDTKGAVKCETCQNGLLPNKDQGATACEKPTWTIPSDCDFITQYLNNSHTEKSNHTCASCPIGASCKGNIAWKDVKAKYGWWRLEQSINNSISIPPTCLSKYTGTDPPCVFEKCLYPHACFGAVDPGQKYKYDNGSDIPNVDRNEMCDENNGYKNKCTDAKNITVRCRLCATCRQGYKRSGGGARCKLCPPADTNRLLLGVGFVVMCLGSAIMVYMQITSEMTDGVTSDAIKKILGE
jgi:hypothetical protein